MRSPPTLPLFSARPAELQRAIDAMAQGGSEEERGAVFTRPEVVDGILDICGYLPDRDLTALRLLEPSVGAGQFLLSAVRRLLDACELHRGPVRAHLGELLPAVRAVELHRPTCEKTRAALIKLLRARGLRSAQAAKLAGAWLIQDDFLLTEIEGSFDVVAGNPPYVRRERIPPPLLREYKARYKTLYDRADLYVLFFERCLDLLKPQGVLGFICSNRWVKNKFGGPLRQKIAAGFNLDIYLDLTHVDAFESQVDAYPSVTVIRRTAPGDSRVLTQSQDIDAAFEGLRELSKPTVRVLPRDGTLRDPWLVDTPEVLDILRGLEETAPTLEASGAQVGIGVATGADAVFIGPMDELDVEPARKLPLALARDIHGPAPRWSGMGLVNPWLEDGGLASLEEFPMFGAFVRAHEARLRGRYTAKQSPHAWYKTIDRVYAGLTGREKLLIPDIKGELVVARDEGRFYPHHNLYVITADERWELRALQTLLRSSVALMFVGAYSVRMSGGFLRFQAQYLRRIRVPEYKGISPKLRRRLADLSAEPDQAAIDVAAAEAYGLSCRAMDKVIAYAEGTRVRKAA